MTCIVFPGQGSQFIGMGKDFHDNYNLSKLIFEEIEDYTEINLRNIIFYNEDNILDTTQYTQICIFTVSYVIFKTLLSENIINQNEINIMMGHSLGEYTALACSNKISLRDSSLILKKRGELMNNAIPPKQTGMAALIGKDSEHVSNIIKNNDLELEIANDNSPIQIVISGSIEEINKSKEIFLKNDIKKFILLNVSAAFHSHFMEEAQQILSHEIEELKFIENKIKIISNFDAQVYDDNELIKNNLKMQMANKVNWTKSVRRLENIGEKKIIEIGPNKVLSSLIKRTSNNFDIVSINKISDIN